MNNTKTPKIPRWKGISVRIAILLACIAIVLYRIHSGKDNLLTLAAYLMSIVMCILILKDSVLNYTFKKSKQTNLEQKDVLLIISLIVLQIAVLQYFSQFPNHWAYDEVITARISYFLPPIHEIKWFIGYPDGFPEWVAKFAIPFFILQKPFLHILGPSIESIRISTLPYNILIIIYLYLLAKQLFGRRLFAFTTTTTFAFLAPHLFIDSIGLHFVSSTFLVLAAFYHFVRLQKTSEKKHAILCGVFAALGFLTYASSYIALPLLVLFAFIETICTRSLKPVKFMIPAAIIFLVILCPFVFYALTKENYFLQRVNQIKFFGGEHSDPQRQMERGANPLELFKKQIEANIQSVYKAGIGGIGGYSFGYQALFNIPTLTFIILGSILALYQGVFLKRRALAYMLITVMASFIFGMVLNIPPGAFHRFSLAFPFIAVLINLAIVSLSDLSSHFKKVTFLPGLIPTISILILVGLVLVNIQSMRTMISNEQLPESRTLAAYIQEFPEGSVFKIASFPTYVLERELLFLTRNKYNISTDYHINLMNENISRILIIHLNDLPLIERHLPRLPNGTMVDTVDSVKLRDHKIFIPQNMTN